MLYNFQRKKLCSHLLVGGALLVAGLGMYSCQPDYDLGEKQPSGLDNIYGYMQDKGNFKNYLRLIDDLGQAEILSKTGSKTMFIADDDAFAKFYASNDWGVKSYEQLSPAQKKLLLNSSMIDNPYSTSMLSSAAGADLSPEPLKGEVLRRASSQTLYDSITAVRSKSPEADAILPHNARFDGIRSYNDSIVLFFDDVQANPMIHFTGKFVTTNKLETRDIDFIYNQMSDTVNNFKTDDVYVNNARVIDANIFCKNGFIHQVDQVIMPLDNMAEIIRKNPEMSTYNKILERFAAPDSTKALTDRYNVSRGKNVNWVYNKRFFSDRSVGSTSTQDKPYEKDKDEAAFDASLKFDPGWNGYVSAAFNDRDAMMEDMAVMLVPTNEAFDTWWKGEGEVIKNFYKEIDSVPNAVFDDLINVGQLSSLVNSVPSRFNTDVLDDANEVMGLETSKIKKVYLGCNGLVYLTNYLYAPKAYSSVLFPAIIDTEKFSVISNAIDQLNYDKYLNSMVSRYIFLLPTNNGLLSYVDPVSYGQTTSQLWEFYLDLSKGKAQQLCAKVYDCEFVDGKWVKIEGGTAKTVTGGANSGQIKNRIENLLDNIIVVEPYQEGKKYYRTKARTFVKVEKGADGKFYASGSMQDTKQAPLEEIESYPHLKNGITVVLDGVVMGTNMSVSRTLATHEVNGEFPFSDFYEIMQACGALSTTNSKDGWQAGEQELGYGNLFNIKAKGAIGNEGSSTSKATYLLNNFNYTIYAPTNEAMQKAYAAGLPTLEDLYEAEAQDEANDIAPEDTASAAGKIKEAMLDFVKYHIQDNSVFVDKGFVSQDYTSGKTELLLSVDVAENVKPEDFEKYNYDPSRVTDNGDGTYNLFYYPGTFTPGRPYKLTVKVAPDGSSMTVTDCRNGYDKDQNYLGGNTANVIMKEGMYNIMAAEYWYSSSSKVSQPWTVSLNNMSSVVIHGIDSPLIYSDGKHLDSNGNPAPSQFIYTYKPLYKGN